jgi:hypothetical protein
MIRQSILPFKIEMTRDMITPHAGLALLGEFAVGLGLLKSVDSCLPKPGSGVGYHSSEYIFPLVLMLNGGGRSLEDTRQIQADEGLREILPLERIPSSDAFGDWLRNMGVNGGVSGLERVNRRVLKRGMKYDGIKGYILDIDATGIKAEKQTAQITYKGFKGYMPIVGHLAENGLVVGDEFREGNIAPATRNLTFIKYCVRQLPKGKRITALRSDSAAYQAEIINYCEREGIQFAIGADLDEAVVGAIRVIPKKDWKPWIYRRDGPLHGKDQRGLPPYRDPHALSKQALCSRGGEPTVYRDRHQQGGVGRGPSCMVQSERGVQRKPNQRVEDRLWHGKDALWATQSQCHVLQDWNPCL